jgi:hypothetical protein
VNLEIMLGEFRDYNLGNLEIMLGEFRDYAWEI